MGTKTSTGSAITPPKGQATRARSDDSDGRTFLTPMVQWFLVILAAAVVIGGILYFGRDLRSNTGGGGGHGAPAVIVEVDDQPII